MKKDISKADSREDRIFNIFSYAILTLVLICVAYPLYFVVIASISDPAMVNSGNVWLAPKGVTFEGYKRVFQDPDIVTGYSNSIIYTGIGTAVNLLVTIPAAYAMSRKDLKGRGFIMFFFMLTMFISGGLIPTYLVVKNLGLIDSMWALIFPGAMSVYNMVIARTFFQTNIPDELWESANIDGCSIFKFFNVIVLPLSKAIIAIMVLYYGVAHWNSYFAAMIYINSTEKFPLQLVLRDILIQNQVSFDMIKDQDLLEHRQNIAEMIKYALIIVSSIPVLLLYPFLQKYFVKGVMIGALKG